MSIGKWKKSSFVLVALLLVMLTGAVIWSFMEIEYLRINSPDGDYTAIVSYRRYESFLPTLAGQSGDKAGFIRIEDSEGHNYGKIVVPMVAMASDLEWTSGGADLKLVGEWDFAKREYRYWNVDQAREIVKQAK